MSAEFDKEAKQEYLDAIRFYGKAAERFSEALDNGSLLHLIRGLEAYSFTALKIVAAFVLVFPYPK